MWPGCVQSLDHVGRVVAHRTERVDPGARRGLDRALPRAALLDAYEARLAAAGRVVPASTESLLPALRARQVVREYLYAARHLPHWRYVPHTALPAS